MVTVEILPSPPLTMVYQVCPTYPAVYTGEYPRSKGPTRGNRDLPGYENKEVDFLHWTEHQQSGKAE